MDYATFLAISRHQMFTLLHETCRACREISVSNWACCHCRARVITKLVYLDKNSDGKLRESARSLPDGAG